jgi:hypothetical protein
MDHQYERIDQNSNDKKFRGLASVDKIIEVSADSTAFLTVIDSAPSVILTCDGRHYYGPADIQEVYIDFPQSIDNVDEVIVKVTVQHAQGFAVYDVFQERGAFSPETSLFKFLHFGTTDSVAFHFEGHRGHFTRYYNHGIFDKQRHNRRLLRKALQAIKKRGGA